MTREQIWEAIQSAATRCQRAGDQVEADETIVAEDVRAISLATSKPELSAAVRNWLAWVAYDARVSGY